MALRAAVTALCTWSLTYYPNYFTRGRQSPNQDMYSNITYTVTDAQNLAYSGVCKFSFATRVI